MTMHGCLPERPLRRARCALFGLFISALTCMAQAAETSPASASAIDTEARILRIYETRLYLADRTRLERVAYTILQAASPYCLQSRGYSLGVPPISVTDVPEDLRRGFLEALDNDASGNPQFLQVPSSPYRSAGVRDGDRLISLKDTATDKTLQPSWVFTRPLNTLAQNMPFEMRLGTGEQVRSLELRPQLICNEIPRLVFDDALIAAITHNSLSVSTGLLRFITSDDELALLLANEIAHSIFLHAAWPAPRPPAGGKVAAKYDAGEERSADYLGTYIAAQAGYDVERATDIWRRVASNRPSRSDGGLAQRHPFTAERAVWQRATLVEIRLKRLNGQPLLPDRKSLPASLSAELVAVAPDGPVTPNLNSTANGTDPRLYRVGDVPFINNEGRAGYQRFLTTPLRPRAFAIGAGATAWSYRAGTNAASDALKTCSTPTVPCFLYAVDDTVVWNPETADRTPQPSVADSVDARLHRIKDVPLINDEGRVGYERFLNITMRPRAFAISPNGSGTAAWASRSGPNASANALAYCLVLSRGRPCYLYAVDDRVVWTLQGAPEAALAPPASDGADGKETRRKPIASGFADVKDLAAVPLPQEQQATYRAFLEKPSPRAFVISKEGSGRYWLGTAAMEDALSYCERLGEACWLYAVDNDVVWHKDVGKRISNRAQLPKQSDESEFLR
ncbi:hypothetical protein VVD49_10205 [Uliginosibacterium sp. H3]|uniref:Peptidase M48 domain-containing protein n=1 Tax=Uliginosibacterium silvisoli TaxID=3114758 RepID=A0ABU6K3C5_9RHOO|nr:hypothetical protein [Uliginosibacterium sp. H3]